MSAGDPATDGGTKGDATGGSASPQLIAAAEAWLAQDPDPETRAELSALIDGVRAGDAEADAALRDRFDGRLAFGTAGLRGEIAAGPNRMNRVLVTQAAAGLAAYLIARGRRAPDDAGRAEGVWPAEGAGLAEHAESAEHAEAAEGAFRTETFSLAVVIGYDGRKNSEVFARDTAEIMAGAGIRAILLPRLLPTPVLAFAVRHFGADAGVMVTASHNPPNDNGYKVYLGGADEGSQIVSPADREIAAEIDRVATGSILSLPRSTDYERAPETVVDAYLEATAAVAPPDPSARSAIRAVYTAMHGVGWETASRVFAAAGFEQPALVVEQIDPDPAFPTVAFPNPEEPGALDLSFAAARSAGAELIIANDPDADRLAVAIPAPEEPEGYRRLTGNEVGALLGWRAAESRLSAAEAAGVTPTGTLVCSIVSSPALGEVARAYGLGFAETLTGFKWVSRAPRIVYGFEEALGYLVDPDVVRDKDGISAAVAFLDLAERLKAQGLTIADQLERFSERFGHFSSEQISIRVSDPEQIAAVMRRLREDPPAEIGGTGIASVEDLRAGSAALPPSDVLRIRLRDGSRIMIRPSGTEPKLKVYLDASSTEGTAAERRADADARLGRLVDGMNALLG